MSVNGLAGRLRRDTRVAHAALESCLPIARPDAGLPEYRDHLGYLLGVYEPLESRLRHIPGLDALLPDLADRWKSDLLREDLGPCYRGPRSPEELLPDPQLPVHGLGALYVLEGATLGAGVLLPRLRANGTIPGAIGSAYLTAYGSRTTLMWERFCEVLNRVRAVDGDAVISFAHATFAALRAWRRDWEVRA